MTPEMRQRISHYADRGWLDASRPPMAYLGSRPFHAQSAYLVLASCDMRVLPLFEVQVTALCYQPFRGRRLVVGSSAMRRFDLRDLKVRFRSQFRRAEDLPLRACKGEAAPDLIQWPLEVCGVSEEISAHAIIPAREAGEENDLGAEFEMILIGEVT